MSITHIMSDGSFLGYKITQANGSNKSIMLNKPFKMIKQTFLDDIKDKIDPELGTIGGIPALSDFTLLNDSKYEIEYKNDVVSKVSTPNFIIHYDIFGYPKVIVKIKNNDLTYYTIDGEVLTTGITSLRLSIPNYKYKVDYIVGPLSFSHHISKQYNKNIYIFGDRHVYPKEISFPDKKVEGLDKFIERTIYFTPKMIDLFLEVKYRVEAPKIKDTSKWSTKDRRTGYLIRTVHKFHPCVVQPRKDCSYYNLRVHYTDKRFMDSLQIFHDILYSPLSYYERILNHIKVGQTYPKNFANIIGKLIENLKSITEEYLKDTSVIDSGVFKGIPKYWKRSIDKAKIEKQINHIKDLKLRDLILDYFANAKTEMLAGRPNDIVFSIANRWNPDYSSLIRDLQALLDGTVITEEIRRNIYQRYYDIINVYSLFIDLYLIPRVFRTFTDGTSPSNIIMYVGDAHANFYRRLLETLHFDTLFTIKSEDQYLNVSNIQQPLF